MSAHGRRGPMGEVQKQFLASMKMHRTWNPTRHAWTWDGPRKTEALLKSLEARGLVKTDGKPYSYCTWTMTPEGDAMVDQSRERVEARAAQREKWQDAQNRREREQKEREAVAWPKMLKRIRAASDSDLRHLLDLASTGYDLPELLERWIAS